MFNYAERYNFNPIKRTIKKYFSIKAMEIWENRGYVLHIKDGRDYYFIFKGY